MSEHMSDAAFTKVFAGMIAGMVGLTILLIIIAYAVGSDVGSQRSSVEIQASNEETIARVAPVASIAVGDVQAPAETTAAASEMSGESVYQSSCLVCHDAGVAGAPKYGDTAAWETRLAQGIEVLYDHAINGFNAMPAKGGNTTLSDQAVKAAVDYMLGQEAPDQGSATDEQSGSSAEAAAGTVAATDAAPASTAAGEGVYQASCSVCHNAGVAGAPRIGEAVDWEARTSQGTDMLYQRAIGGLNAMPPKGGNTSLSDGDVKAAVDYMLSTLN